MSLRARAEMAESKLRWIEDHCRTAGIMRVGANGPEILRVIHAEVWDGYQVLPRPTPGRPPPAPAGKKVLPNVARDEKNRPARRLDHKEP